LRAEGHNWPRRRPELADGGDAQHGVPVSPLAARPATALIPGLDHPPGAHLGLPLRAGAGHPHLSLFSSHGA
jgi:hypothetical protein